MARYRVGIIGCGYPCDSEGATGMGVPHAHAGGYAASPDTHCVLPGDIDCENASSLQAQHGGRRICEGDGGPLAQKSLDIIGTCPQPRLYAPMVIAAAEADVKATRCEKP